MMIKSEEFRFKIWASFSLFVLFLAVPLTCLAKSKFEVFIAKHPFLFALSLLGTLGIVAIVLILPIFLIQFRKHRKTKRREFKKQQKKELKNYLRQIPKIRTGNFPLGILYRQSNPISEIKTKHTFSAKNQVIIGSNPGCYISIPDSRLSRKHALIRAEEGGYVLYDLASRLGVTVNNREVSQHLLKESDIIRIGPYSFLSTTEIEKRGI